ncbi:Holliday junction resolvase RecU [Brevibacillus sp. DP1.3A]|uniref:Holliday junction resolvase RecU n=1 Tax=Brevibacillus sp. DP1.3A TaxID=2738867 RepID=UPI00156BB3C3|nr:Holliday junction resolvase RecU [Brevibacillus sp. DP1.3A]UED78087.1 Holliday junction resolvase RecU [Brevibacillus sp. DP1.3A]
MNHPTIHANRGQAFEKALNTTHSQYKEKRIALIDKTSGTSHIGTYKGRALYFEAISTRERTRFDLSNIDKTQYERMEEAQSHGAICFVLIDFAVFHEVMFVPFSTFQINRLHASTGGQGSIPKDDFEHYGYVVQKTKRARLDYLLLVDMMINAKPVAI